MEEPLATSNLHLGFSHLDNNQLCLTALSETCLILCVLAYIDRVFLPTAHHNHGRKSENVWLIRCPATNQLQMTYPQFVLLGDSLFQNSIALQDGFSFNAAVQSRTYTSQIPSLRAG